MKQLLQSPATGSTTVADVPAPLLSAGMVLVRTVASVVSAGTERTSVEFAKKSLLAKARSRSDLVKKVLDKALTDGALTAWDAARNRLEQPQALGYSSAGVVIAVGEGAEGFRVGDRVACAGGGYASHAEIVRVPTNLAAPVPEGVALEHAAFATVGAIGLHGLRLAEPLVTRPGKVWTVVHGPLAGRSVVARPHRPHGGADGEGRRLQGRWHRRVELAALHARGRYPLLFGVRAGARRRRGVSRGRRGRSRRCARAHGGSGGGCRGRGRGRFVVGSRRARPRSS